MMSETKPKAKPGGWLKKYNENRTKVQLKYGATPGESDEWHEAAYQSGYQSLPSLIRVLLNSFVKRQREGPVKKPH